MFEVATAAVEGALAAGARYADARGMILRQESMSARNGDVEDLVQRESVGVGVRALVGSSWGFVAVPDPTDAEARRAGAEATAVARASALVPGPDLDTGAGRGAAGQLGQPVRGGPARRCRWRRRVTWSPV